VRVRRGRPPRLEIDAAEAGLLATLARELAELFDGGVEGVADETDPQDPLSALLGPFDSGEESLDPVIRRLLPDAYRDDAEAAADWRRLGRSEVRSVKSEAIRLVLSDVSDVAAGGAVTLRLDGDHLGPWLAVLTDMRLAIGTRLDITEDWVSDALRLADDDPRRAAYSVYDWLSVLQESIVRVA
jgi:hypothetical protein